MPDTNSSPDTLYVTVHGPHHPVRHPDFDPDGHPDRHAPRQRDLIGSLFSQLARFDATVLDVEQVQLRGRLALCAQFATPSRTTVTEDELQSAVRQWATTQQVHAELTQAAPARTASAPTRTASRRSHVTVVGHPLTARTTAALTTAIHDTGGHIERITSLARRPVTAVEFDVTGVRTEALRSALSAGAHDLGVDLAVCAAGLSRRARRLVVMDVDSTLIQGEVIDMLARHAGREPQVAAVTAAAMRGELDFEESLRARVAHLAGLAATALDEVRDAVELTPGALTLIRTLQHLGCRVGMVSGGFTHITDHLARRLGLDFAHANTLEVADGRLTGRLTGPVIDRRAKAELLIRQADRAGIPLAHTVAIGDGANDLDMLNTAGLGVAFNAKPVVRGAAPTTLNVPFLDSLLYLLGIPHEELRG
ncbi:phosphoserine phosphatase SerB [Streptomyces sp. CT34]|uniref:phosphoserine phosphatase SerB n=1 Tax=Streptomyces sp. CT34 TaxID=1553907 RepID=UPI00099BD875|nr:phosphoserine phosphatase SerB [Streptomyces sp. CT34]